MLAILGDNQIYYRAGKQLKYIMRVPHEGKQEWFSHSKAEALKNLVDRGFSKHQAKAILCDIETNNGIGAFDKDVLIIYGCEPHQQLK